MKVQDEVYDNNRRLNEIEFRQQNLYVRSRPRCLGIVLGTACNVYCPHCYQSKNGENNLLKPVEIGRELRHEFSGWYPYVSTLRVQGGEVFAIQGFGDLIEDIAATVRRPILSVSTNGTLIGESWAETIVRTPFRTVTISIDGGTPTTYARVRRGADFDEVLENIRRIGRWKEKLGSELPYIDSHFIAMRSNFREIPQYLNLMSQCGICDVGLQTMQLTRENVTREPSLADSELIRESGEVRELYGLMRRVLPEERKRFRKIRTSGLRSLFEEHGLDGSFLMEEVDGLYPDSDGLLKGSGGSVSLCPNPWTTLFVVENGDVHLCFLSEPVGNIYEASLENIWNSQKAASMRSDIVAGRYRSAGCSPDSCSWREGKRPPATDARVFSSLRAEMKMLLDQAAEPWPSGREALPELAAVRKMLSSHEERVRELQLKFVRLCETNRSIHDTGQEYIDYLEARRNRPLVRLAESLSDAWERIWR